MTTRIWLVMLLILVVAIDGFLAGVRYEGEQANKKCASPVDFHGMNRGGKGEMEGLPND